MLVFIAVVIFGVMVYLNSRPAPALTVIVPTQGAPTEAQNGWEQVLQQGFGNDSTPLPTVAIPTANYVAPTLALSGQVTPISPADVGSNLGDVTQQYSIAASPTFLATVAPLATNVPLTEISVTRPANQWNPPPLIPPVSHDPLGRDHYYLSRPVDSSANNKGLFYYSYGTDGPDNTWRIHTGLDMPNPIGQTIRAAGEGTVVWAGPSFQSTFSYGNVVMIEHDFGFNGRRIYTLYAHMSAVLVVQGQFVQAGDAIGLVGNTGRVTGPHVHFEVRLGDPNSTKIPTYGDTYNPLLWMVPYVGTGVIAGVAEDASGHMVNDADITVRNWATGLNQDTTTSYVFQGTSIDVNSDPVWDENFAVSDIPVGRYQVIANINGNSVSSIVNVIEGTTTFVTLREGEQATPQPTTASGS